MSSDGSVVTLDDQFVWSIASADQSTTSIWTSAGNIVVSDDGSGGCQLNNTCSGDTVGATYVGSSEWYSLSNEGTCVKPGGYCRESGAGASGIAGDGQAIFCTDNDGLRRESE
jgi:hypothetical protein